MYYFFCYLVAVNIFGLILTVHDKICAIRHGRRVSEHTLMVLSAVGGAPLMYLAMLLIRHKTRKPLFMIGIPLIVVLELLVLYLVLHYVIKAI